MQSIKTQSPNMQHLLRTLPLLAQSDVSVLIQGETGTGKSLFAHHIHAHSRRKQQPLVVINCAALPVETAEIELFGAVDSAGNLIHRGRLLAADGGTVLFDDVDALPLPAQALLLHFLETGDCQLSGGKTIQIDARILATTQVDLHIAVANQTFRADLLYRLEAVPISLPALRERAEDISLLLPLFAKRYANGNAVVRYSKLALQLLNSHPWQGNIRELANLSQRLALASPGKLIRPTDLPQEIQVNTKAATQRFTLPISGIQLADVERDLISQALERAKGNRARAARLLGLTRDTLLYRIQKHAL